MVNKAKVRKSFGLYDLLEDLMKFHWQSGCDCCLCVGGGERIEPGAAQAGLYAHLGQE